MESRKRNLIIVGIILLLLILFSVYFFFWRKEKPITVYGDLQLQEQPVAAPSKEAQQQEAEQTNNADLLTTGKIFAERYGSFSSESNYANLRDLLPLMTDDLAGRTEEIMATPPPVTEPYGMTTRVLSTTVNALSANAASLVLSTQKEETKAGGQTLTYPTLLLEFQKINSVWKVSSVTWQ